MKLLELALTVKKALVAAAGVATALIAVDGIPVDWKQWLLKGLGVLATYGVVYEVKNKTA